MACLPHLVFMLLVPKQANLANCIKTIDPPGHGRIGGHYFHTWCPYVRTSVRHKNENALQRPENKIRATKKTMRENNDLGCSLLGHSEVSRLVMIFLHGNLSFMFVVERTLLAQA